MTFYDSVGINDNQERENKLVRTSLTALPEPFLSGLKLNADISLYRYDEIEDTATELVLNTIDENDVVWVVSEIDGWWTLPEPETPDLPRGWGDGSYDAVGRWVNRIMTLSGSFLPQRPEDAPAARNKLMDALSVMVKAKSSGYLIVNEPDGSGGYNRISAKVRLSGTPIISSVNARGRHNFSIGLKAVDPVKYEFVAGDPDGYRVMEVTPVNGSASATITNHGNTAVPIIIELSKGFSVPEVPPGVPVQYYQRTDGAITLQFFSAHPFSDGQTIYLYNIHPDIDGTRVVSVADVDDEGDILQILSTGPEIPFDTAPSNAYVTSSPPAAGYPRIENFPQFIDIIRGTDSNTRLEIDTYNREVLKVTYDGEDVDLVENGRSNLPVIIDWIYLKPGSNTITLARFPANSSCNIYYKSGWIG